MGATLGFMGREHYKTPDEDVAAEFDRVCQLFQLALGKPSDRVLFDSLMGEASANGLNWIQGLEYVVRHRRPEDEGAQDSAATAKRSGPVVLETENEVCTAA